LKNHTFLNAWAQIDEEATQTFCSMTVSYLNLQKGEYLFEQNALGQGMHLVTYGHLFYEAGERAPEHCLPDFDDKLHLIKGSWCSEIALWTVWSHMGTMKAIQSCEVTSISFTPGFIKALEKHMAARCTLIDYCRAFHGNMNEADVDPSDLVDHIDCDEIIFSMSRATRIALASPFFDQFQSYMQRAWGGKADLEKQLALRREVEEGKCDVGMVGAYPMRTTFVIVLLIRERVGRLSEEHFASKPSFLTPAASLFRSASTINATSSNAAPVSLFRSAASKASKTTPRVLVRIGMMKHESSEIKPCCVFPGGKRKENETRHESLQRVLESDLKDIVELIVPTGRVGERSVEVKYSANFGIKTRYLKTTYSFELTEKRHNLRTISVPPLPWGSSRGRLGSWRGYWAKAAARAHLVLNGLEGVIVLGNALYVWLRPSEFDILSSNPAEEVIAKWLGQIQLDRILSDAEEGKLAVASVEDASDIDWRVGGPTPPPPQAVLAMSYPPLPQAVLEP
jgi:hypothetical protein